MDISKLKIGDIIEDKSILYQLSSEEAEDSCRGCYLDNGYFSKNRLCNICSQCNNSYNTKFIYKKVNDEDLKIDSTIYSEGKTLKIAKATTSGCQGCYWQCASTKYEDNNFNCFHTSNHESIIAKKVDKDIKDHSFEIHEGRDNNAKHYSVGDIFREDDALIKIELGENQTDHYCKGCCYEYACENNSNCCHEDRDDDKNVIFKKIKNNEIPINTVYYDHGVKCKLTKQDTCIGCVYLSSSKLCNKFKCVEEGISMSYIVDNNTHEESYKEYKVNDVITLSDATKIKVTKDRDCSCTNCVFKGIYKCREFKKIHPCSGAKREDHISVKYEKVIEEYLQDITDETNNTNMNNNIEFKKGNYYYCKKDYHNNKLGRYIPNHTYFAIKDNSLKDQDGNTSWAAGIVDSKDYFGLAVTKEEIADVEECDVYTCIKSSAILELTSFKDYAIMEDRFIRSDNGLKLPFTKTLLEKNFKKASNKISEESSDSSINNNNKNSNKMEKRSMFNGMMEKIKGQFIPTKESNVRISLTGEIAIIQSDNTLISIDAENQLVEYPEDFGIDVPVYSINKPLAQVVAGDIVKVNNRFFKVTKIGARNIMYCISYTGFHATKIAAKDFLLNGSYVRVVFNMFNFNGGASGAMQGINPMMMYMCMKDSEDGSSIEDNPMMSMMLMQSMMGDNQAGGMNPMMMMLALKGDNDSSIMESMMIMQMMQGNNGMFGNMFGNLATQATHGVVVKEKPEPVGFSATKNRRDSKSKSSKKVNDSKEESSK